MIKEKVVIKELTYQERYDIWLVRNYETGMEHNYDVVPDFDNPYYEPTPIKVKITYEYEYDKSVVQS